MEKEIIDVVDTAIKIGLGALISGVTTYFLTKNTHSNDKKKSLIEKRVSVLEFSTENIDPYFHALSEFMARVDGILRAGEKPGKKTDEDWELLNIIEFDNDLVKSRAARGVAMSRLRLIGGKDIIRKLSKIAIIEDELRQQVIFNKTIPTNQQLVDYNNRIREEKNKFYTLLENEFSSTYS
ncbi:MAG: hypothetical protein K0U15_06615 [Proteobacteria bacterium]|nr:hypothetical protein [Pseudomonadota bacterium]